MLISLRRRRAAAAAIPNCCPVHRPSLASARACDKRIGRRMSRQLAKEEGMDRRSFIVGSTAAAAAVATRPSAAQDTYPSRAITIVNPFPPGGASDVVTRPLAAVLEPMIKH